MQKVLTVVVPSYNSEEYLEECLETFVNAEVMDDIEILIVNDGSKDRTAEIAGRYVEKYPFTFRLITKANGGHGSAINTGIAEASGKYFKVVDSDDWVHTENFVQLVKRLRDMDVDIAANNYTWVNHITRLPEKRQEYLFGPVEYNRKYAFEEIADKAEIGMHAMTVRTELLRRAGEKLDEHTYYVDVEFITFPIPYVETVIFYQESVYQYRLGRPGQSMSVRKMQQNKENHLRVLLRVNSYCEKMKGVSTPAQTRFMNRIIATMISSQIKIYVSFPLGSGMRRQALRLEAYFYRHNREAFKMVRHPAVILMRGTRYLTFPLIVCLFRHRRNTY